MAHALMIVAAVGSAALAGFSSFRSTQAANAQAEGEAEQAKMNAQIMAENSALEKRRQERDLKDSRRKYNLLTGTSRAQAGALGMFGGSSLDVLSDISQQGVFEQESIVDERVSARQNYNNQAAAYKARASNLLSSRQSPWLNAGIASMGSALGSIGSIAGSMGGGSPSTT